MYIILHESTSQSVPICRLCGSQRIDLSYIDLTESSGKVMALCVQKYLGIEVLDTGNFPKSICKNCNGKVEDWNDFYNKCNQIQCLLKSSTTVLEENLTHSEASPHSEETPLCNDDLSKLVEELVQNSSGISLTKATLATREKISNTLLDNPNVTKVAENHAQQHEENCDSHSATEDEFEEVSSSENDIISESCYVRPKRLKLKQRQKKFIFNIPFLEKKMKKKFSPEEKCKLQKHISKRQNTLIYEMLVGGGPNQEWRCQICQETIRGRACEVAKHYLTIHQVQPIFPCHVCDYTSRTEKMYQAHRMSHLVEYPCEHCGKTFSQPSRLVYHMNSHTNEREFECEICKKKFNTAQYVTTHKRKVHGDQAKMLKYTCELCGMRFKYKNHLQYHLKRHPTDENPLPYSCKYCEGHFMTRAEQLAHSNTVHAGEGDFVCHLCGKKMKTMLSLENHVKLHSGEKDFKCEACGAAFATHHSLKCHRKIHERGPDNSMQYVCHVCQKPMSNRSSLNQHLKTHQGTKPHRCQHCSASFIHKNRLEIHMRKHTGEFPHSCIDCGKGFRSTSSMNSHRQYVHSERKFTCETCQKAFKTSRDLKVHSTLHTGEKPNVCGTCGKAFRVRANYFKHRKIHLRTFPQQEVSNSQEITDPDEEDKGSQANCVNETVENVVLQVQEATIQHNLTSVVVTPSTTNDFYQFNNDQPWIT